MRLSLILLLLFFGVPAALAGMAALGTPTPCVDRTAAAADAPALDWVALAKQAAAGGTPTLTVTEAQATAMARQSLSGGEVPVTDVRVFFCPDGHAEVAGRVTLSGWTFNALLEAGIDSAVAPPMVEVRGVRVGSVPGVLTSWVVGLMPEGGRSELPLPAGAQVRIEDGRAVLTGGLPR
ncbi:MAG: hypothetical protein AB7G21_11515 [Dehalococcoidia bacterium]